MNAEPSSGLFRREAIAHKADRLQGDIRIAAPVSWHVIGYGLLAAVVGCALYFSLATYSRAETVKGSIILDRGVAPVVAPRRGIVSRLLVREGDLVRAGAPLAEIRSEEQMVAGGTLPQRTVAAVEEQEAGLARQSAAQSDAGRAAVSRLEAQATGLRQELASIGRQIAAQEELVAGAVTELESSRTIARRGFISRRDLVRREEDLLLRRQQLAQLEQTRIARQTALQEALREAAGARAEAASQLAGLDASRAQASMRRLEAQAGRGFILTAPVDGRVTAVAINAGQSVGEAQTLMTVVPRSSAPRAELEVPTSAIGFLAVGQDVKLAIDAFPYQRFGTVEARIVEISATTVGRPGPSGSTTPVYLAVTEIRNPFVSAFGNRHQLLSGMTLSARIVTERRSLLQWLFEPLFAVANR
jgi:membrane fusion protein